MKSDLLIIEQAPITDWMAFRDSLTLIACRGRRAGAMPTCCIANHSPAPAADWLGPQMTAVTTCPRLSPSSILPSLAPCTLLPSLHSREAVRRPTPAVKEIKTGGRAEQKNDRGEHVDGTGEPLRTCREGGGLPDWRRDKLLPRKQTVTGQRRIGPSIRPTLLLSWQAAAGTDVAACILVTAGGRPSTSWAYTSFPIGVSLPSLPERW